MHIEDISITSFRKSVDGKRISGDVTFLYSSRTDAGKRRMTIGCDTLFSAKIRNDAVLIGDAIRQIRKLPEIQSGAQRVTFSRGLRPLASAQESQLPVDRVLATG